ncbi:MAG: hypothetical protein QOF19_109 [Alphaproteobacteria bacterium]|jgi:hypothetical protein|nr:hypothetical protein [Alphaproteobacteria bacterium]
MKASPLLLEEYKNCKQQILEDIKWMDQLEVYVVGAVATVYVFVFAQKEPTLAKLISIIPLFVVCAGALRTAALDSTIGVLNDYLVKIEKQHTDVGYTQFYRLSRSPTMKTSRYIVWGTLLFLSISFAFVTFFWGPFWLNQAAPCRSK